MLIETGRRLIYINQPCGVGRRDGFDQVSGRRKRRLVKPPCVVNERISNSCEFASSPKVRPVFSQTVSEAALEPPRFDLGCLLTEVHLCIVELDQTSGRALDAIARRVIIPPTVTIPWPVGVVGPHGVVRHTTSGHGVGRSIAVIVRRSGSADSAAMVGSFRAVT